MRHRIFPVPFFKQKKGYIMRKIQMKSYLGDKAFYKQVTCIALPVMAQQFVTSFVNLIDNMMIGGVGQDALTAVTVANRCYMLATSVIFGLTGAAGIFIAQNYGAQKKERCQKFFNINLVFSLLIMLFFTVILVAVPQWTLHVFTKTPEIVMLGLEYNSFVRFTYIPYGISVTCMMAMRAIGLNKVQLKVGALTVITNSALNFILIYGHLGMPAMGVKGAALATLIARLLEMGIYLTLLLRKTHFYRLDLRGMLRIDLEMAKDMMKKAIPLTANELIFSVGMSVIFKSYIRTDEHLVAAISVVDTVMNMAFIIFGGLSSAISIFIGGKLGAGKLKEAREEGKKIMLFALMVSVAIGFLMFCAAPFVHHLYNLSEDAQSALLSLLRIKSGLIPIYVFNVCTFFIFRAGGDTISTLIIDSGYLWAGPVLVSTVLSMFTSIGLVQLFLVVELLDLIKMYICLRLLKKGRWVRNLAVE